MPRVSFSRALAIVLTVIVGVEAFVILEWLGLGHIPLTVFDFRAYDQLARNMLEHFAFSYEQHPPFVSTTWRTPGYPAFLAFVYLLAGYRHMAVYLTQFALIGATAWLLYRLAIRFTDRAAAAGASVLCAVYPPLVFTGWMYFDGVLSTFLAVATALAIVRLNEQIRPSLWSFGAVGVGLGFFVLVRGSFVVLFLFLAAALLVGRAKERRRELLAPVVVLCVAYVLTVTPWILRNHLVGGPFNLGAGGGWGLYVSTQQYAGEMTHRLLRDEWLASIRDFSRRTAEATETVRRAGVSHGDPQFTVRVEVERDRKYIEDARAKLRSITVGQIVSRVPSRLYWLWSTAPTTPWRVEWFHRLQQVLHVMLALLVVIGFFVIGITRRQHALLLLFPVYLTLFHLIMHVEPRYTLHARPFLLIYAGVGAMFLARRGRAWAVARAGAAGFQNASG